MISVADPSVSWWIALDRVLKYIIFDLLDLTRSVSLFLHLRGSNQISAGKTSIVQCHSHEDVEYDAESEEGEVSWITKGDEKFSNCRLGSSKEFVKYLLTLFRTFAHSPWSHRCSKSERQWKLKNPIPMMNSFQPNSQATMIRLTAIT